MDFDTCGWIAWVPYAAPGPQMRRDELWPLPQPRTAVREHEQELDMVAARASRASSLVTLLLSLIACGGLQQSYGAPHRVERAEPAVCVRRGRMMERATRTTPCYALCTQAHDIEQGREGMYGMLCMGAF